MVSSRSRLADQVREHPPEISRQRKVVQSIARCLSIALAVLSGAAIGLTIGYLAFLSSYSADLVVMSFHDWAMESKEYLAPFWAVMGALIITGAFVLWFD